MQQCVMLIFRKPQRVRSPASGLPCYNGKSNFVSPAVNIICLKSHDELSEIVTVKITNIYTVAHLAWKSFFFVSGGQLLISLFSIKPNFLLRLEINRWILQFCQSIISAKFHRYTIHRQYVLTKATTLVFCTECSEIQVATSSLIN